MVADPGPIPSGGRRALFRRAVQAAALSLPAAGLGACAGAPREFMAPVAGGYDVTRDIPYGDGPRRRLDVYRPRSGTGGAPRPVILYYFGGLWTNGSKDDPSSFALPQDLAARGALVVVPDYRLFPETGFPGFMQDAAAAAAWARRQAAALGSDPRLVFLSGHSSGAHMALLLGTDPRFLREAGFGAPPPAGLIGVSGVYEPGVFALRIVRPAFREVADPAVLLPASHLGPATPPALLLAGSWDLLVDPGNATRLAAAIRAAGGRAEARVYPGLGHFDILGALPFTGGLAPTAEDIAVFVRARAAEVLAQG